MTTADRRSEFRALHESGSFVMPNPWDVGSAKRFADMGFRALATTSYGFAQSIGKDDNDVTFDEVCAHVTAIVGATDVPVNVDSQRMYADDVAGVGANAGRLAELGVAGMSIEDYVPSSGELEPIDTAAERVAAAADVCARLGVVLTARAEGLLYGLGDLDDTLTRLRAFRRAGADVVYAPGPSDRSTIETIVAATDAPVNVLLRPGIGVAVLRDAGVRRVSTGSALASAAFRAGDDAARALLDRD